MSEATRRSVRGTLLLVALTLFCCAPMCGAQNMLTDPGFERDMWTPSENSPWSYAWNGPGTIWPSKYIGDPQDGHLRPRYVMFTKDWRGQWANDFTTPAAEFISLKQLIPVVPGQYQFSCWYRIKTMLMNHHWDGAGKADQFFELQMSYHDAQGVMGGWYAGRRIESLTPQWTKVTERMTIPSWVAYINVYPSANILDPLPASQVDVDDVYFGPVIPPSKLSDLDDWSDGSDVTLPAETVSRKFTDHFYIEENDRTRGIKVIGTTSAVAGQAVSVRGTLSTASGERQLTAISSGSPVASTAIRPLGIDPGRIGGVGLSTVGLLMRTAGRVGHTSGGLAPDWFTIVGASGCELRVQNYAGVSAEPGNFVTLTAVHGRYAGLTGYDPVLKLASVSDFQNSSLGTQFARSGSFDITQTQFSSDFVIQGNPANVSLDSSVKYRGTKSLKITHSSPSVTHVDQEMLVSGDSAGRRIRISAMFKAQNIVQGPYGWNGVRIVLRLMDADGELLPDESHECSQFQNGATDWRLTERSLILPAGVAKIQVWLLLDNCAGTVWFDDLNVCEVFDEHLVPEDNAATISINGGSVISTMPDGLGWAWDLHQQIRFVPHEIALLPELFSQMAWDGTDWIRVTFAPGVCPPSGYKTLAEGGDTGQPFVYNFNTGPMSTLVQLLTFCQGHGINFIESNLGTGYGDYFNVPNGQWLTKGYYEGRPVVYTDDSWMPYSKDRMAEYLAELTYYLRVTKGFSCIKYVNLFNEVGSVWPTYEPYPQGLLQLYDKLDTRLRAKGIRNLVQLEGLDAVESGLGTQITVDGMRSYGANMDAAGVHDYAYGMEVPTDCSGIWLFSEIIDGYKSIIQQLKTIPAHPMRLVITENNGFTVAPAPFDPRYHYMMSLSSAEFAIEMLKAGVGGLCRWQYNGPGYGQYSPFVVKNFHISPYAPIYFPTAVLTRWTVKNSQVLDTQVAGGGDARNKSRVRAVTLKAPGGQVSILLTNTGRIPKQVTINLTGVTGSGWKLFYFDSTLPNGILQGSVAVNGSQLTVRLPAESVSVITSFAQGLTGDAPM